MRGVSMKKFTSTLFYFDDQYTADTAGAVLSTLKHYGFFCANRIFADRLTGNQFVFADSNLEVLFLEAACVPGVLQVVLSGGHPEAWSVDWGFTFQKNSPIPESSFRPWNTLTIHVSHEWAQDAKNLRNFLDCFEALISTLHPFYGLVDDLSNELMLQEKAGINHFLPETVQMLYWGNYFGPTICGQIREIKCLTRHMQQVKYSADGVLFFLTDDLFTYASPESEKQRSQLWKALFGGSPFPLRYRFRKGRVRWDF